MAVRYLMYLMYLLYLMVAEGGAAVGAPRGRGSSRCTEREGEGEQQTQSVVVYARVAHSPPPHRPSAPNLLPSPLSPKTPKTCPPPSQAVSELASSLERLVLTSESAGGQLSSEAALACWSDGHTLSSLLAALRPPGDLAARSKWLAAAQVRARTGHCHGAGGRAGRTRIVFIRD